MTNSAKRALVLGRQMFVDLWALEGFEKIICEDPAVFSTLMKDILNDETGFVIVEESWFNDLPDLIRQKLERFQDPVIIPFPSITNDLI